MDDKFIICGINRLDMTTEDVPEDFAYQVTLIVRDPAWIDANATNRKAFAEAVRLLCEKV